MRYSYCAFAQVESCAEMFRAFATLLNVLHPGDSNVALSWKECLDKETPQNSWSATEVLDFLRRVEKVQREKTEDCYWLTSVRFSRWISGYKDHEDFSVENGHSGGTNRPGRNQDFAEVSIEKRHDEAGKSYFKIDISGRERTVDRMIAAIDLAWNVGFY